ncbi:SAM-dependent methyltransferase [Streptomyces graminilatus]|uniref:SAM-dependent methyltransferase n=1 Tax=Streptomyces graminilatus TaxID=1464070 RepID=UPI00099F2DB5|nr:SAM-dependent methyltransferase [Streptomyces graminilatus]
MTEHTPKSEGPGSDVPYEQVALGQDRPHSARLYDYFLGGKTNYAVDRDAARDLMRVLPAIETVARVNRAYMRRAVRYAARQGVRQFLDLGTGFPDSPHLHEVAQDVARDCRVVYADTDPIVLVYGDELLDSTPEGRTCVMKADVTRPEEVLAAVAEQDVLDLGRPVAVSLHAVLHLVLDTERPHDAVSRLLEQLAPGSYLSVSHCTADLAPDMWRAVIDVCARHGIVAQPRRRSQIRRFFAGLQLVEPGVVPAHRWRPEAGSGPGIFSNEQVCLYAGMARKT